MSHLNWLAVLVSGLAYFFLGFLWYQLLFGKVWGAALDMNRDSMPKGDEMKKMMMRLLPRSFLGNLVAAIGVALLVVYSHAMGEPMRAAKVGAVAGLLVAGGSMWMHYNWLGKSKKAWLIDVFYAAIGCGLCGAIVAAW